MEATLKAILFLIGMFILLPFWAYLMSKLISLGWHNGKVLSLLSAAKTMERKETNAETKEESDYNQEKGQENLFEGKDQKTSGTTSE